MRETESKSAAHHLDCHHHTEESSASQESKHNKLDRFGMEKGFLSVVSCSTYYISSSYQKIFVIQGLKFENDLEWHT